MGSFHMRRPSPAMAVALLALFIALGGTSYGLATGAIDSREIKNNTVRDKDIRNGTIGTSDVKNGALLAQDFRHGDLPAGEQGPPGPPGKDATPADFAGEATRGVTAAPVEANQCSAVAQFCTGSNNWRWRNYGNGYQAVGFWKDRGGVVHLEGVAELFGGAAGGQPSAFILPAGYRPTGTRRFTIGAAVDAQPSSTQVLRFVEVRVDGQVDPDLGGAGIAPLDGIAFRP
jgi:hypothetical protein